MKVIVMITISLICTQLYSSDFLEKAFKQDETIEKNGDYSFSTGPSFMTLHSDHRFSYQPHGVSGRTIEGWWKYDGSHYVIVGKWGWINGAFEKGDFRQMKLDIRVSFKAEKPADKKAEESKWLSKPKKLWKPYWNVEELVKTNKTTYTKWEQNFKQVKFLKSIKLDKLKLGDAE